MGLGWAHDQLSEENSKEAYKASNEVREEEEGLDKEKTRKEDESEWKTLTEKEFLIYH